MSKLLGADTRRVDVIAEGLRGHSLDVQSLRTNAQRAVAEMRQAWGGRDFERFAQRWEQEAGPRMADVSSALSTMATALRTQAEAQRRASAHTGGSSVPVVSDGRTGNLPPGGGGAMAPWGVDQKVDDLDPDDLVKRHLAGVEKSAKIDVLGHGGPEPSPDDKVKDKVRLNVAQGDVDLDASLASLTGGGGNARYELSAGRVEAKADYSVDVDAHGNLVASAGASAAAYLGYAAGRMRGGGDFANGTVEGKAYVGAEVKADASGSIGRHGATGHLGAEAFAGGMAEVDASGTVGGVTATAGAEISYGVGAHGDLDAALSATNVGVSVDVGATLGIGAGVKFDVSVNPHDVMANVDHAVDDIDDISDVAADVGQGLALAGGHVASFLPW